MDPKPGYLTTEFWTTNLVHLITVITMIAAAYGNDSFDGNKLQPLIPMASLLMSGLAQAFYNHSRAHIKVATTNAAAQVVSANAYVASGMDLTGPQD